MLCKMYKTFIGDISGNGAENTAVVGHAEVEDTRVA